MFAAHLIVCKLMNALLKKARSYRVRRLDLFLVREQLEWPRMKRTNLLTGSLSLAWMLILTSSIHVTAANARNFIEAVRRRAPVVYVGTVREVRVLSRTKFDIKARAVVSVSAVLRGLTSKASEARVDYSSFDEKTPILDGGPQFQLKPGVWVVIFANSFENTIPPGYLLQGSREELLQRVEALRNSLRGMTADQLSFNEINGEDRHIQLALYDRLIDSLRAAKQG